MLITDNEALNIANAALREMLHKTLRNNRRWRRFSFSMSAACGLWIVLAVIGWLR